jgi:hypothetical protein
MRGRDKRGRTGAGYVDLSWEDEGLMEGLIDSCCVFMDVWVGGWVGWWDGWMDPCAVAYCALRVVCVWCVCDVYIHPLA